MTKRQLVLATQWFEPSFCFVEPPCSGNDAPQMSRSLNLRFHHARSRIITKPNFDSQTVTWNVQASRFLLAFSQTPTRQGERSQNKVGNKQNSLLPLCSSR